MNPLFEQLFYLIELFQFMQPLFFSFKFMLIHLLQCALDKLFLLTLERQVCPSFIKLSMGKYIS